MEGRRIRNDDLRRPGRGGKGKKDFKQQEVKDKDYDRNAPLYDNPSSAYAPGRRHRMEDRNDRGERSDRNGGVLEVFERSARQDAPTQRSSRAEYAETTSAVRLDRGVQILNRPKVLESQSYRNADMDRGDRERERNHRSTEGRSGSERERNQEAPSSKSTKGSKKDGKEAPAKKASGPFTRCRFLDEDWKVCNDQVDPLLLENKDFMVVATLGAQKVGRSTVLSTLLSPFFHEQGGAGARSFQAPLAIHTAETFLEGGASCPGVDLCITKDRLVLLDAQPLFESVSAHPLSDLKSELQLMLFLSSICHCMLVVTDTEADPELWKFLRLLATLKAKVPDLSTWLRSKQAFEGMDTQDVSSSVLPRLLVVFNNMEGDEESCELIEDFLKHTEWKAAPWIRTVVAPQLPGQSAQEMLCSKEAAQLGQSLRHHLLGEGPPRGLAGLPLTEKQWMHHLLDYWDFVRTRGEVQSYFDLLTAGRLKSFDSPDPKSM